MTIYGYEKKLKTNHTLLCIILEMRNEVVNNQVKVALLYLFNHRIMESKKNTPTNHLRIIAWAARLSLNPSRSCY